MGIPVGEEKENSRNICDIFVVINELILIQYY